MASTLGEDLFINTKEEATETQHQGSLKGKLIATKNFWVGDSRNKEQQQTSTTATLVKRGRGVRGDDGQTRMPVPPATVTMMYCMELSKIPLHTQQIIRQFKTTNQGHLHHHHSK
jgi:hypothetical protein